MSTDPQMQTVLDALASFGAPAPNTLPAAEARRGPTPADAVKKVLVGKGKGTTPEPVGSVRDLAIPGPAGEIQARCYTPVGDGPFPVLTYFHGGGWVIADLDTYDSSARALANAAECIVVSCHYRQAPEHPYPAAHEDAVAATRWVMAHAAEIGGDSDRVAIAGESAGGNLATTTCLEFIKQGWAVPVHQLLVYPVVDAAFDTPSYVENADAKPLVSGTAPQPSPLPFGHAPPVSRRARPARGRRAGTGTAATGSGSRRGPVSRPSTPRPDRP